jgi:hypothetical protein
VKQLRFILLTILIALAITVLVNLTAKAASTLINLATQVTGTLALTHGGTGNTTGQPTAAFLTNQITSAVTLGTSSYTASSGTFPAVTTTTAGTWRVFASVNLQTTSTTAATNFTCEIFDGTTVLASGYILGPVVGTAAVKNWQMSMEGTAVEAGTVTFTARCTSTTASQLMEAAAGSNSGGNNASTITALRIQ